MQCVMAINKHTAWEESAHRQFAVLTSSTHSGSGSAVPGVRQTAGCLQGPSAQDSPSLMSSLNAKLSVLGCPVYMV